MSRTSLLTFPGAAPVDDVWEAVAHQARVAREAGGHPDDVLCRLRRVEDEAITLSRLFGTADGEVA